VEQTEFRIGELAKRAGVSVDAVRYYERLKLLPRARRTSGGFRLFGPESIERVQFIKQAQELGLTLDEIKGLLTTGGAEECRSVRDLLSNKIGELDGKMSAMKDFRRTLARHVSVNSRRMATPHVVQSWQAVNIDHLREAATKGRLMDTERVK
jgi:DNA-binding transcriptional MerR regulator